MLVKVLTEFGRIGAEVTMVAHAKRQHSYVDVEPTPAERDLHEWRSRPIEEASSFPPHLYISEAVYQLEQQRIFRQRWLFAGHLAQLQEPGSYFTITLAGQPLVIARDLEGQLRGFFNVCPHRAGPIALGAGNCRRFTCLYHAWTFDLKGELKATPHMAHACHFDVSQSGLKPIQVDTWASFIFVNLDPSCSPLLTQLDNLPERFQPYWFSNLIKVHQIDYEVEANWKLYVENSSESYHAVMVHPSLQLFRNLDELEIDVQPHSYTEYLPFLPDSREMREGFAPGTTIEGLSDREMRGTSVTVLFPNFVLVACPNFVLARMVNPQGLAKTQVRFIWFVPNTNEARSAENVRSVVDLYDSVVKEDLQMLKYVQQGVQSGSYEGGRLSPKLEVGVHHFQKTVMESIAVPRDV